MTSFKEYAREKALEFLRTVVFIDDMAFVDHSSGENMHLFDASDISKAFATKSMHCSIYAPKELNDLKHYHLLLKKSDVVVLDWNLNLSSGTGELLNSNEESDVEDDDPRGKFTLSLLQPLVKSSYEGCFHLVVIYTGETDLVSIANKIQKSLKDQQLVLELKDDCDLYGTNIRILVRAKGGKTYQHIPDLQEKVVAYAEMPDFILDSFVAMTQGLLSCYALWAISIIRASTPRILTLYSPDMDVAYLTHKLDLPNPEDARAQLRRLFGDSIVELLDMVDPNDSTLIESWVDDFFENREDSQKIPEAVRNLRKPDNLKKLLKSPGAPVPKERIVSALGESAQKWQGLGKKFDYQTLFAFEDVDVEKSRIKFAELTHHKHLLLPLNHPPYLTLGTIVKLVKTKQTPVSSQEYGEKSLSDTSYFVCIQQKCDSVRLNQQEERRFLFLPLTEVAASACAEHRCYHSC